MQTYANVCVPPTAARVRLSDAVDVKGKHNNNMTCNVGKKNYYFIIRRNVLKYTERFLHSCEPDNEFLGNARNFRYLEHRKSYRSL